MSNSFALHFAEADLGASCLQRITADDTCKKELKEAWFLERGIIS